MLKSILLIWADFKRLQNFGTLKNATSGQKVNLSVPLLTPTSVPCPCLSSSQWSWSQELIICQIPMSFLYFYFCFQASVSVHCRKLFMRAPWLYSMFMLEWAWHTGHRTLQVVSLATCHPHSRPKGTLACHCWLPNPWKYSLEALKIVMNP